MPYESDPIASKLNDLVSNTGLIFDLTAFEMLNPVEQALVGTWELANEVYNGGFVQYFQNSSRDHAKPMIGILRSIGAFRAAEILEAAAALASNCPEMFKSVPSDLKERLNKLDRDLYDELDNLHLHVFRYLSRHRAEIDVPEDFWIEVSTQ